MTEDVVLVEKDGASFMVEFRDALPDTFTDDVEVVLEGRLRSDGVFEATTLLTTLATSGRSIVGFDLNEVAPGPHDEWDANVGARLLYRMIGAAVAHGA